MPLQYGESVPPGGPRTYGTLQEEALKISATLCPMDPTRPFARYGTPTNPVELIKNIVQVGVRG